MRAISEISGIHMTWVLLATALLSNGNLITHPATALTQFAFLPNGECKVNNVVYKKDDKVHCSFVGNTAKITYKAIFQNGFD